MKKILFTLLFFFISSFAFAQSYQVDYYGSSKPGNDALNIAVGDTTSGEYYFTGQITMILVDSNWTASNIAFEIYNPKEETWELLQEDDGTLIEYTITQGKATVVVLSKIAGIGRVRFAKVTSGSYVEQATNATSLIVYTSPIL